MAGTDLHLHVVSGILEGTVVTFPIKKKVTVGRTRVNAFPIKHDTVSQRHAVIVHKDGRWVITDSDSSNGTSINGALIDPGFPTELNNGDLLGIGPENEIRVKVPEIQENDEATFEEKRVEQQELLRPGAGQLGRRVAYLSLGDKLELPFQEVSVNERFHQSKEWLFEDIFRKADATIQELMDQSEALKKKIRDGEDSSNSLRPL